MKKHLIQKTPNDLTESEISDLYECYDFRNFPTAICMTFDCGAMFCHECCLEDWSLEMLDLGNNHSRIIKKHHDTH